jgi:hypothetical protein
MVGFLYRFIITVGRYSMSSCCNTRDLDQPLRIMTSQDIRITIRNWCISYTIGLVIYKRTSPRNHSVHVARGRQSLRANDRFGSLEG